jgi:hypothetical protein
MIHTSRVSSARRFLALFLFYLKNFILPCFLCCHYFVTVMMKKHQF